MGDSTGPQHADPVSPLAAKLLIRLQTAVQWVLAAVLFAAVLTSPVYESRFGVLGARGVWVVSIMWLIVAAQCAWTRSSRRLRRLLDPEERQAFGTWLSPAEAWTRLLFLCVFLLAVNQLCTAVRDLEHWGVVSNHDQPQYYAYLHSWVFDRDMDFENEYRQIPAAWELMSRAHPERPEYNVAPIGTAVLWLPFYLCGHMVVLALNHAGLGLTANGISVPYAMAAAFGSVVLAWLGMRLTHAVVRRWFTARTALLTVLLVWFASPLPWYLSEQPWMSHAASLFAAALVFWVWRTRGDRPVVRAICLGASIGLAMLVRPSHVVLLLLPAADAAATALYREDIKRALVHNLACLAALCAVFSLQVGTWLYRYGMATPPGSPMSWTSPALVQVLFSAHHGAIPWHPALLAGFLGVPLIWRKSRRVAVALAAVLLCYIYLTAAILAWPAGGSFGMRRLVGVLPFLAPGIAAFGSAAVHVCQRRPWIPAALSVALLGLYNSLLLVQFRDGWVDPLGPVSFEHVWQGSATMFHGRYGNPFTYPASLWFAARHGVRPGQYDIVTGVPAEDAVTAEGVAIRPFLGKGWYSSARKCHLFGGACAARDNDCSLLLNLKGGQPYAVKLRVSLPAQLTQRQQVAFTLNGTSIGGYEFPSRDGGEFSFVVPGKLVADGVNTLGLAFTQLAVIHPRDSAKGTAGRGLKVPLREPLSIAAKLEALAVRPMPGE